MLIHCRQFELYFATVVHCVVHCVCFEHVRSAGADACGVADAIGGDTSRLVGVCVRL